jgi:hypothetical protein
MPISQQTRQKQLFCAEDWQVLYQAFTQVNFNSYDFNTIRNALVTYCQIQAPEDFNDWIESSEFVAIIELLSYLGTSLALRMDLNTRENFLDTAQRRDSIFRLAQMLNYQPQRCLPSVGFLKITQIVTNQTVYDSDGNNLANIPINWNDQNNSDWYEQFIVVLNSALNLTNQFGNPNSSGSVGGIQADLYSLNNISIPTSVIPFVQSISGNSMNFELVNPIFAPTDATLMQLGQSGYFIEQPPNPANSWNFIYQVDGNGYGSPNTGFFVMFKQGSLAYSDFSLTLPIANRIIDINANRVNQTDVWVENISSNGAVTTNWVQVPSVNSFNIIYNSINQQIRDIYSVISRDSNGNDQISIRFADGNFGNVPTGILRIWYRTSNGLQYQIRPADITNSKFNFVYNDNFNNQFSLTINTALQNTISNSQTSETNDQIKLNASAVYYTQDRMVNGEDYNLYPLQSSQALKVKAVNRTYSGQSRYIDLNDPTGSYQNTNVIGDDGILYFETDLNSFVIPITTTYSNQLIAINFIQPVLNGENGLQNTAIELRDFFYTFFPRQTPPTTIWQSSNGTTSNNGAFFRNGISIPIGAQAANGDQVVYITSGSLIKFSQSGWTSVVLVIGSGTGSNLTGMVTPGVGAVTLASAIANGDQIVSIYPAFDTTLNSVEITNITNALNLKQTFGMGYNTLTNLWYIIQNNNLNTTDPFSITYAGSQSSTNADSSWLVLVKYVNGTNWTVITRAERFVIESVQSTRFFFINTTPIIDINTNNVVNDYVNILGINSKPSSTQQLGGDYYWKVKNQFVYPDGYTEPNSVQVTFWDSIFEGLPNNPDEFISIVDPLNGNFNFVFWQLILTNSNYNYWNPITIPLTSLFTNLMLLPTKSSNFWLNNTVAFVVQSGKFYSLVNGIVQDVSTNYKYRVGRNNLYFVWKHYAPYDQRIDPAIMNIIDIYILTASYDTALRNWIATSGSPATLPIPPNSNELLTSFNYFSQFKMMTDQIVWHPVSYKLLFGVQADTTLQVIFKVVKTNGSTYSDNEVKSLVIKQINNYFALANWDFGQSFFFTELATYIHVNLATIVGSIVIVPKNGQGVFGDLFEIKCDPDEIFISCAQVSDIQIVANLSEAQLGIS